MKRMKRDNPSFIVFLLLLLSETLPGIPGEISKFVLFVILLFLTIRDNKSNEHRWNMYLNLLLICMVYILSCCKH